MKTSKKNIPKTYNHSKIEPKWRKVWAKNKLNQTQDDYKKPKFFVLDMFPYPSGAGLHVGHPRGFIATDVYSRYKKMHGFNVLHPMGWDAFGLPAENYAIKNKTNPADQTKINVKRYKEQTSIIGFNYDWEREINTTDPKYYKWTQWIFLKLLEKGLAYESYAPINWCPSCKTGLALEDLEDGKCERCGSVVEKKPMRQWVLKITDYADRLLKDIDTLNWPESVKESQRNWIGRSEGMIFTSPVKDMDLKLQTFSAHFEAFAADTFVVIAPDHPLLKELVKGTKEESKVLDFAAKIVDKRNADKFNEDKEIEGIFTGRYTIDPVGNGELPIWVASYALADYGTGIVKCSAHDDRDYAFAKKYNIKLKEVLEPLFIRNEGEDTFCEGVESVERNAVVCIVKHWSEDKYLCLNWKKTDWKGFVIGGIENGEKIEEAALREIREETGYKNARFVKSFPIIHSKFYQPMKKVNRFAHFKPVYVELIDSAQDQIAQEEKDIHEAIWISKAEVEKSLTRDDMAYIWKRFSHPGFAWTDMKNSILTEPKEFAGQVCGDLRENIKNYLVKNKLAERKTTYRLKDWVFSRQRYWGEPIPVVHCAKCGVVPVPEKDLPVVLPKVKFYEPTGTGESPLAGIDKWVNTKCPKCKGKAKRETNTMPQWAGSSWYYLRYMDPKNSKALVDKKKEKYWAPVDLYVGGTEHATRHLIYARFWHKFLYDIGVVSTTEPFSQLKNQGMILGSDNRKMSKRWGNVINPDEVVKNVGADTLRVYEMFMGPFEQEISWSTDNMIGSRRFLERVWKLQDKVSKKVVENRDFEMLLHQTIKKVTDDILGFNFNTAISAFMILINAAEKIELSQKDYEIILKLLAPFAPHITEEIWANLGHKKSIHLESWPEFNPAKAISDKVTIVVQINGKARATFEAPVGTSQQQAEKIAFALENVSKWVTGKEIRKILFIKEKILSIITN